MIDPDAPEKRPNDRGDLARRCFQLAWTLLLTGLVLAFLALWGQRRATASAEWRDPADAVRASAVAPDLALLSLAGVPDDQVLALSIEKVELGTTHALLAFSGDLTDRQRTNGWLWLAFRYHQAGHTTLAAQAYRLAGLGAILSSDLPDLLRTETLLAVGRQLIALHDKPSASYYLKQTALIAAYAPQLTPYHRRSLLERLIPALVRAGGKREDWTPLAKAVESGQSPGEHMGAVRSDTGLGWWDETPQDGTLLAEAQAARRVAAAALLSAVSAENGGNSIADAGSAGGTQFQETDPHRVEQEARQALSDALLGEDAAVRQHPKRPAATSESDMLAQQTLVRCLLLKRRIAAGGGGAGLVPDWESDRDGINVALTAAWTDWLALRATSTEAGLVSPYRVAEAPAARQAIVAAYWGLYPDAPVTELVASAQAVAGIGPLRLTVLESGTPPLIGWSD